jgi:2-haloalkanoic acid dehalogenase type II
MAKLSDYQVLCFDVYGTLVDWETGIVTHLQPLLEAHGAGDRFTRAQLLNAVHECEHTQQAAMPGLTYRELLTAIHPQIAARLGLAARQDAAAVAARQAQAFGASVGSWPAFPDTVDALRRLARQYKLVVLSNVDRDSFAGTNSGPLGGVPFDLVITAQDVGSYKPDLGNFRHMIRDVQEKLGVPKEGIIQTAQSQFHDHRPAKEMGMKSSWIVRPGAIMGNRENPLYDWKFDTLGEMADALDAELETA